MGATGQMALSEQPEIIELFRVLEGNGMAKELQEVDALVKYLENMENQFGQVLEELKGVREQLAQIEDKGVGVAAARVVGRAEDKVQEIGEKIAEVKDNLICSAKSAVRAFQEKGTDALRNAVSAMKIPLALSALKGGFHNCMVTMNQSAGKMEMVSSEIHDIGGHMKNIVRALAGKEPKEPERRNPDKGILAKVQKAFLACGRLFSDMEKQTGITQKRMEQFCRIGGKKSSVRAEINQIKSGKAAKPLIQPERQEQTR